MTVSARKRRLSEDMMIANALWSNYFQVGEAALSCGDSIMAENMFREALLVSSLTPDLNHQADSTYGLALSLLRDPWRRGEAQQLLRKAVRLYIAAPDLNCTVFASCVSTLADSYGEEFPERALPLLKEAVKVVSSRYGLASPYLVPLFKRMALIYSEKSYHAKAEHFFKKTLG